MASLIDAQFEPGSFNVELAMVAVSTLLIGWLFVRTMIVVVHNEPQLID